MNNTFLNFWSQFQNKPLSDRRKYFDSLAPHQQSELIKSFRENKWCDFFAKLYIDNFLDWVKFKYDLDLLCLRIQSIKYNKVFLVERVLWETVERVIFEYQQYFNTDLIFGGLQVSHWGRHKQFCKIRAKCPNQWR